MRRLFNRIGIKIVLIILLVLVLATGLIIGYVLFMENTTYERESLKKAALIEEMMYEEIWNVMRLGGTGEDISNVIKRINKIEAIKDIKVIRSPSIDAQYKKESEAPRYSGMSDGEEIALLLGQEVKIVERLESGRAVKVIRPALADLSCMKCHKAKSGEALGAISFRISLKELDEEVKERSKALIFFFVIDMLVVALCLLVILRITVIVPLEGLASTMDKVTKGGSLDHKVEIKSKDEIGDLSTTFNTMIDELQESRKRMLDWSRSMEDGIRERTRRLSVFIGITKTLASSAKAEEKIELALDKMLKVLPKISSAKVSIFGEGLNKIRDFVESGTLCEMAKGEYDVTQIPQDVSDSLMKFHKPYLAPDVEILPSLGEYLFKLTRGEKVKSAFFFPIIMKDIPRGFLSIFTAEAMVLLPDEIDMFSSIASSIGLALEVK